MKAHFFPIFNFCFSCELGDKVLGETSYNIFDTIQHPLQCVILFFIFFLIQFCCLLWTIRSIFWARIYTNAFTWRAFWGMRSGNSELRRHGKGKRTLWQFGFLLSTNCSTFLHAFRTIKRHSRELQLFSYIILTFYVWHKSWRYFGIKLLPKEPPNCPLQFNW